MHATASIGPSIEIKGTISAQESLVIAGKVTGSINMPGHELTIVSGGIIDGDVAADGILVGGKAHGRLHATSRIALHDTAVVEGTLLTPVMSVADGAAVQAECAIAGRRPAALPLAS